MDALTDKQRQQLHSALLQAQQDLQEQLAISKDAAGVVELDQSLVGRVSRMDAMQQQGMAKSTRDKVERRLRKVNLALAAMECGEYGRCKHCDEWISAARLQAQPEASLCINCQNRADQQA